MTRRVLAWLLLSIAAVHLLGVNLGPVDWFGDDVTYLKFAAEHPSASVRELLTFDDGAARYRPLTKLLALVGYRVSGSSTVLPHLASGLSWALTLAAALALARRLDLHPVAARAGVAFFALHQLPVQVVYRNARMEHHFTLFGLLALLLVESALARPERAWTRRLALAGAGACLLVALLWSEAAACFGLVLPVWALVRGLGKADPGRRAVALRAAVLAPVVLAVFIAWYWSVGAPLHDIGRHAVGVGPATVSNLGLAVAGWLTPVCSVEVIEWARRPWEHVPHLAGAAALAAGAAGLLLVGLWRARRDPREGRTLGLLLATAGLCLLPVALIQQVSEAYLYPSTLFFCLAAGPGWRWCLDRLGGGSGSGRLLLGTLTLLIVGGHLQASAHKVGLLRENGRRFHRFVGELETKASARERGVVYVLDASGVEQPISQYILPMQLVYHRGYRREYWVQWVSWEAVGAADGESWWLVRADGSIEPIRRAPPSSGRSPAEDR